MDASTQVFNFAFWNTQLYEIGELNNLLFRLNDFVNSTKEEIKSLHSHCAYIEDHPNLATTLDKNFLRILFQGFNNRREAIDPLHFFNTTMPPSDYFDPDISTHLFALPLLEAALKHFHDDFVTSTAAIEKRVKAILKEPEETYPDVSF